MGKYSILNASCLAEDGQPATFTPAATEKPQTITGILRRGAAYENAVPGQGSTNAGFWIVPETITPTPKEGDRITLGTSVYQIILLDPDEAGGAWLHLRFERENT
jgi:hypothetical protein